MEHAPGRRALPGKASRAARTGCRKHTGPVCSSFPHAG